MKFRKTLRNDLDSWKTRLSSEDIIKLDSDLDDYTWYSVIEDSQIIAVFQIINVIKSFSKNLDIKFSPTTRQENKNIVGIIIFIYESMLQICKDEKVINKIKIHTHDPLMKFLFQELSNMDKEIKSVKKYGKWVEIDL